MSDVVELIAALDLAPHPEGGWFRETVRQPSPDGGRDIMTAIYFLLEAGQRSHWHRGAPLLLSVENSGCWSETLLGPSIGIGQRPQVLVAPHAWQSAEARDGWSLVSCVVTPGFDFAGFELAEPGWAPR